MDACSQCPHPNECLKTGACLDELNAPFVETRQPPRRMTPEQANTCMAALREGKTIRRFTNGGKFGPAIVSLNKLKKHCALYPEWGEEAMRLQGAIRRALRMMSGFDLDVRLMSYGSPSRETLQIAKDFA
jgi:hypothetical protein